MSFAVDIGHNSTLLAPYPGGPDQVSRYNGPVLGVGRSPFFLAGVDEMKRTLLVAVALGLTATWMGCQPATDSTTATSTGDSSGSATSNLTQVSLRVPNMT